MKQRSEFPEDSTVLFSAPPVVQANASFCEDPSSSMWTTEHKNEPCSPYSFASVFCHSLVDAECRQSLFFDEGFKAATSSGGCASSSVVMAFDPRPALVPAGFQQGDEILHTSSGMFDLEPRPIAMPEETVAL
jgi:hypothetical protein